MKILIIEDEYSLADAIAESLEKEHFKTTIVINGLDGEVSLTLDSTSTITLTGNSYVKSLTNSDSTNSNINLNGYKLYINGVELVK